MKNITRLTALISGTLLAGGMLFSSCTDSFESMNIDPNGVTDEEMDRDNLRTGAFFTQMQRGVFIVGKDEGGTYQVCQMLTGDIFASYFANIKASYDNVGSHHHDHYAMADHWYNMPFNRAYTDVMQPWAEIVKHTEETSVDRAMATVVKVFAMSRITDKYGPIPYSKFGTDINVAYDSQQEVYNQFFTELDNSIDVMQSYQESNGKPYMEKYDFVYQGNVAKWLKMANTLRLRLAMRISYVDEAKARTEIQKALDAPCGLMATSGDDAYLNQSSTFAFTNPIYEVTRSFNDLRMSATMDCYLNGYNDPRLKSYFVAATSTGEYHGVRNGLTSGFTSYPDITSAANFNSDSNLPWMHAAEAWFLQAEAKLRFGLGSAEVKDLYEEGIRTSFASAGVTGADSYIQSTATPSTTWVDPRNNQNINVGSMLSNLAIAWDNNANNNTKLERIMIQKWIALYPDGQEAWSEMRRTGYPGWIRISTYSYASGVSNNEMISRIQFPSTEFSNNSANAQEAVQLLGGQDNAGTRLWWDVKR